MFVLLARKLDCVVDAASASQEGRDVSLGEKHFAGLQRRGWCRALALLPCLSRARSVRLQSFRDSSLRSLAVERLQQVARELCPKALRPLSRAVCGLQVAMVPCSFCEEHLGEQIELFPRCLRALRRPGRKGGGLLLGTGPLWGARRSFAVRLERLSKGERLDIGVTAQAPFKHFEATRRRPQVTYAEAGGAHFELFSVLFGGFLRFLRRFRSVSWCLRMSRTC